MTSQVAHRHCRRCDARLARDNPSALCAACTKAARDYLNSPPLVPSEFWQHPDMQDALDAWHIGRVIRAFRRHKPATGFGHREK